jgi:hypothetical protein
MRGNSKIWVVYFKTSNKTRTFSVYGGDTVVCLVCNRFDRPEVKLREDKLQNIKSDVLRQRNIFALAIIKNEATIRASFAMTQIIAKK